MFVRACCRLWLINMHHVRSDLRLQGKQFSPSSFEWSMYFVQEKQYVDLQIAHADLQNAKRTLHAENGRETAQGRRDVSMDGDAELVDQYMPTFPLPSLYSV